MKMYDDYYQILKRRGSVKLKAVWIPFGIWYNKKFNFEGKTMIDFGSSKESKFFKKFKEDNKGNITNYKGYDIDIYSSNWLKENNLYYDFWNDDSLKGRFDSINCSQCYEHLDLNQREKFIERSYELLKEGGTLIIDIPHIANINIVEFFRGDRTHKPVSREDEAIYIEAFRYKCEIYLAGLTMPYKSTLENLCYVIRNMSLGFYPQWITVIIAKKVVIENYEKK